MAVNPINRREAILSGESVTPSTRLEAILSGENITPVTREEYFLKTYAGGSGGNKQIVIPEQTVIMETVEAGYLGELVDTSIPDDYDGNLYVTIDGNRYVFVKPEGSIEFVDNVESPTMSIYRDLNGWCLFTQTGGNKTISAYIEVAPESESIQMLNVTWKGDSISYGTYFQAISSPLIINGRYCNLSLEHMFDISRNSVMSYLYNLQNVEGDIRYSVEIGTKPISENEWYAITNSVNCHATFSREQSEIFVTITDPSKDASFDVYIDNGK